MTNLKEEFRRDTGIEPLERVDGFKVVGNISYINWLENSVKAYIEMVKKMNRQVVEIKDKNTP